MGCEGTQILLGRGRAPPEQGPDQKVQNLTSDQKGAIMAFSSLFSFTKASRGCEQAWKSRENFPLISSRKFSLARGKKAKIKVSGEF